MRADKLLFVYGTLKEGKSNNDHISYSKKFGVDEIFGFKCINIPYLQRVALVSVKTVDL